MEIQSERPQKKSNKKIYLALGALVLVAVLVGAAFLAGNLINKKPTAGPMGQNIISGPGLNADSVQGIAEVVDGMQIDLKPAPELPTTPSETTGVFTRRVDNSIFLGTGSMGISITSGSTGSGGETKSTYDGPEVEIVVTKETRIYRDVTPFEINPPSGSIQQTVEIGNLDDLNSMVQITVWGRKIGDRIVADVILYSQPVIINLDANQ